MNQHFWFLAVFEAYEPVDVPQGDDLPSVRQLVPMKWTRTGTINVNPRDRTEDLVPRIEAGCKSDSPEGGVPADALLVDVKLLPNLLAR